MSAGGGDAVPFVTVVCPVLDEVEHVGGVLECLLGGDYPPERMEVLVVDGGSTDGTRGRVGLVARRDRRVRLLDNAAGTTPAGLNVGIGAARGDVVVRIDGHAFPAPDYVRACTSVLRRTGAWVAGGPLVFAGTTAFGRAAALALSTPLGTGGAAFRTGGEGPVDTVYLGAWPRWVLDHVGPFDETLTRNQDYELCYRVRAAGGMVWLDRSIRTVTVARSGAAGLARQYFGYGQGRAATSVKHPGSLRARQALPAAAPALALALLAASPASGRARRQLATLAGAYVGLVAATSCGMLARERPGTAARAAAVFPLVHAAWAAGFWLGIARAGRERRG